MDKQQVMDAILDHLLQQTPRSPEVQAIVDQAEQEFRDWLLYGELFRLEAEHDALNERGLEALKREYGRVNKV